MIINNNVPRKASSKGKRVQEITALLSEIILAIFSKCLYNIEKRAKIGLLNSELHNDVKYIQIGEHRNRKRTNRSKVVQRHSSSDKTRNRRILF